MADMFRPTADSARRDPISNAQQNGNIVNPPRMAELGGFSSVNRGIKKNSMGIVRPGASTRREPVT
jgi:hypothetical protein